MPVPPTNTLVDREAAWLDADATVHALCTITPYTRTRVNGAKSGDLRITRTRDRRVANGRREIVHDFALELHWPVASGGANLSDEQRYLGALVDALRARIHDQLGSHTHGGIFLSAGENEDGTRDGIDVEYSDPAQALLLDTPYLTATVTYSATELLITI